MRAISVLAFAGAVAADCSVDDSSKSDCGYVGIDQNGCESKGCCWKESIVSGVPWCYYKAGQGNCFKASTSSEPPFSDSEISTFTQLFMANINVQNSGAVVAAPDHNTPGGDYYFHWERDGALTIRTLFETQDIASIDDKMKAYVGWVQKTQAQQDPNNIDVRTEPKYTIPDGKPYTGGWCRPQTDGPGLRAIALMKYANHLLDNGDMAYVQQNLWTGSGNGGPIKYDLDWVAQNWQQNGCDLWEEVQSNDFFWNRFNFKLSMQMGAAFAKRMGDAASAGRYSGVVGPILSSLKGHWTGSFVAESANRQQDGATITAFNYGYDDSDGMFAPTSAEVAGTVKTLINTVCTQYPINQKDTDNGIAGLLLGRYPGDTYAGGNPWILTSGALATLFYRGATAVLRNATITEPAMQSWRAVFGLNSNAMPQGLALARLFATSGDGVLERIKYHIKGDGFHMDEQLDKNSGMQISAKDLTWSYAEVIKATHTRAKYYELEKRFTAPVH